MKRLPRSKSAAAAFAVPKRRKVPVDEVPWTGRPYAEYQGDFQFLADHNDEFNKKYKHEWVAILNREVIDHGKSQEALLDRLRASGDLLKEPVVAYCPAVPENARF